MSKYEKYLFYKEVEYYEKGSKKGCLIVVAVVVIAIIGLVFFASSRPKVEPFAEDYVASVKIDEKEVKPTTDMEYLGLVIGNTASLDANVSKLQKLLQSEDAGKTEEWAKAFGTELGKMRVIIKKSQLVQAPASMSSMDESYKGMLKEFRFVAENLGKALDNNDKDLVNECAEAISRANTLGAKLNK